MAFFMLQLHSHTKPDHRVSVLCVAVWKSVGILGCSVFAIVVLVAAFCGCEGKGGLRSGPIVNTTYGAVQGVSGDGYDVWHSIPYAARPLGPLRFHPPTPPQSWNGVKDVSGWPEPCPQFDIVKDLYFGNEDCLYLEVWRPSLGQPDKKLPVMLFIYGGGYSIGDSSEFGLYNGQNMVKNNDVILVAMNYRLGSLGFLSLPELMEEGNATGTYGVLDQRMAMEWVQANIEQFGGDPNRVAIFGESAGAFSVCWHLAASGSKGLFQAAISESGTCDSPQFFRDYDYANAFSARYAGLLGCNSTGHELLACLRKLDVGTLLTTVPDQPTSSSSNPHWAASLFQSSSNPPRWPSLAPLMPWGVALDGAKGSLSTLPLKQLQKDGGAKVPTIFLTNADEFSIFVPEIPSIVPGTSFPPKDDDFVKCLQHVWAMYDPSTAALVAQDAVSQYPANDFSDSWKRATAIFSDYFFHCAARRSARALEQHGVSTYVGTYSYHYEWGAGLVYDLIGNAHTTELPLVFQNTLLDLFSFSKEDIALSDAIQDYWTNMARSGTPNGPDTQIPWPVHNSTKDWYLDLANPISTKQNLYLGVCDFWDQAIERLENSTKAS